MKELYLRRQKQKVTDLQNLRQKAKIRIERHPNRMPTRDLQVSLTEIIITKEVTLQEVQVLVSHIEVSLQEVLEAAAQDLLLLQDLTLTKALLRREVHLRQEVILLQEEAVLHTKVLHQDLLANQAIAEAQEAAEALEAAEAQENEEENSRD